MINGNATKKYYNGILNDSNFFKHWDETSLSQKFKYMPKYIERSFGEMVTGSGIMAASGILNELGYKSHTKTLTCFGVMCFFIADGQCRIMTEKGGIVEYSLDGVSYLSEKASEKLEEKGYRRLSHASKKVSDGLDYASFKIKSFFHGKKKMERIRSEQLSKC